MGDGSNLLSSEKKALEESANGNTVYSCTHVLMLHLLHRSLCSVEFNVVVIDRYMMKVTRLQKKDVARRPGETMRSLRVSKKKFVHNLE